MVIDGAFIFHMHVPWDKTFSLVLRSRSSVQVNVKYQGQNFQQMAVAGAFVLQKHIWLP